MTVTTVHVCQFAICIYPKTQKKYDSNSKIPIPLSTCTQCTCRCTKQIPIPISIWNLERNFSLKKKNTKSKLLPFDGGSHFVAILPAVLAGNHHF